MFEFIGQVKAQKGIGAVELERCVLYKTFLSNAAGVKRLVFRLYLIWRAAEGCHVSGSVYFHDYGLMVIASCLSFLVVVDYL